VINRIRAPRVRDLQQKYNGMCVRDKKNNNVQNIEEFPVFHLWPYSPIQFVSKKKKEGEK